MKKPSTLVLISIFGLLMCICLSCMAGLYLFSKTNAFGFCATTEVERKPGVDYDAVYYYSDCGATTAFRPNISLVKKGEDLPNTGNIFSAYKGDITDFFWERRKLVIIYDEEVIENPDEKRESYKGVDIQFISQ